MSSSPANQPLVDYSKLDKTSQLVINSNDPCGRGGSSDIYQCMLHGEKVAVKVIRIHVRKLDQKVTRRINREVQSWAVLKHDHVLSLRGICFWSNSSLPSFISSWMENGSLDSYLKKNPFIDIVPYFLQIASGLLYLHKLDMVHGDIRAGNVLVSNEGIAKISDFGLSRRTFGDLNVVTSDNVPGTLRWMAVEYFRGEIEGSFPEQPRMTKESDVWAFGMTVLELWSGKVPFAKMNDLAVLTALHQGKRPELPFPARTSETRHAGWLEDLCQECWALEPSERPTMSTIYSCLR
ncbi:kinase-like protein [Rickenella mellea]|uniref:Kinase-like protein n=1 Tax=Rickenella mellea TaxID=50990 RepID=A0A4Y7PYW6_9AGAM|nr:kinase-like protein [Rickenella mellea]